jgi:hypothetical protein
MPALALGSKTTAGRSATYPDAHVLLRLRALAGRHDELVRLVPDDLAERRLAREELERDVPAEGDEV